MKKKILIIDDEKEFTKLLEEYLEGTGKYKIAVENDGTRGLSAVKRAKPDLVLLDLLLPDSNGLEICRALKAKDKFAAIPVIIVSGQQRETDKVSGLDIGADDYMVKPFSLRELDARIRAVLRRSGAESEDKEIMIGDSVVINTERYQVTVGGNKIDLTATEFMILKLLASKKSHVFKRSAILDYLWESPESVTERTIDVHIKHLREKLGGAGKFVQNVRGVGYKIEEEAPS
jgi:DNA-binding response OmpR family regulator